MEPPWFKYQINKLILFLLRKSLKDHGLGLEFMGDLSSTMITIILLVGMVFSILINIKLLNTILNNILLFLSSADIILLLISNVVSGSLPQHVELARIIQTEVVKHNWSNNKLSRSRVG